MDGLAFVAVVHVAIAAHGGVRRPFVARDADELTWPVEVFCQGVEFAPERAGDLEVIALVAHDVEVRLVPAELEIFPRRIGAQCLVRLAVRVAPEMDESGVLGHYAQRVGAAQFVPRFVEHAD